MEIKGTKEAFVQMLSERGVYKKLGVDRSTVANWKTYLKEGRSISLDKMEEMLLKYGASVVQEKVWKF
jgi:transposase